MERLTVINGLIKAQGLKGYLEIGVGYKAPRIFESVECENKLGIDPEVKTDEVDMMTSEEFFKKPSVNPDIIFVDGDHTYQQVVRDLINSYYLLPEGGFLVAHDVLPADPSETGPEPQGVDWCGDVWAAWLQVFIAHPNAVCVGVDHGIGILQKREKALSLAPAHQISWNILEDVRKNSLTVEDLASAGVIDIGEPAVEGELVEG